MTKFVPFRRIEDILTQDEMQLYRRHIEDAVEFIDLEAEFELGRVQLYRRFCEIESKLREAFRHA